MDLETFCTTVYVLVDDWYKAEIAPQKARRPGPAVEMSDSEVMTVAVLGQWRKGVAWQSERSLVRYMQSHGRQMFPTMLGRSRFNARVRDLYGVLVRLQQYLGKQLTTERDMYECVDCEPLPAFSNGQACRDKSHWLFESTVGRGGTSGGFFWGDHLLAVVTPHGAVTGWLLGSAYIQDRWLMEGLLSARAGHPQLAGPPADTHTVRRVRPTPPIGFIGPFQTVGASTGKPYLADRGFSGERWITHWQQLYQATVISAPPANDPHPWTSTTCHWLASHRQIIDTVFAFLDQVFGMKQLQAHSRWGQLTRIAAKMAAYNLGLFINRLLNRPAGALATLIC